MLKVLIVDDELDIALLFRHKFRQELQDGAIMLYFIHNGRDALNFLQDPSNPEIDVVITDINMPGMTGLDLTRVLKSTYPEKRVFIVTAYGGSVNYETSAQYGADAFLTKPLEFSILKEKLSHLYLRSVN